MDLRRTVWVQGRVARVVIAAFDGSSPREVGAAMVVWADGQSGTIGGGALEWQAVTRARAMLAAMSGALPDHGNETVMRPSALSASGAARLDRQALGPDLGQCCGGVVSLLTEVYDASSVATLSADVIARPLPGAVRNGQAMPLAVARLLAGARNHGNMPVSGIVDGWMVEPVVRPLRQMWIWGAGHVGRAIVAVMAPLPGVAITWVDIALDRFPQGMPTNARALPVPNPALAVALAPPDAEHIVLTYSHALDLELCHRLLIHGFARVGLIGSASKWARFRGRLAALGHAPQSVARIDCPIGDPSLGKHPQAIAIGVAAAFLAPQILALQQERAK